MIDALHAQLIQRSANVARRRLLAGVCGALDLLARGDGVELAEERRREGQLVAIEADASELAALEVGQGRVEGFERVWDGQVAQEAHDEQGGEAELALGALAGGCEAGYDGLVGDAAGGVGLWVEENFGVADALGVGALEVVPGEVLEVGGGQQHGLRGGVVR